LIAALGRSPEFEVFVVSAWRKPLEHTALTLPPPSTGRLGRCFLAANYIVTHHDTPAKTIQARLRGWLP
jgi:hypothetical protein